MKWLIETVNQRIENDVIFLFLFCHVLNLLYSSFPYSKIHVAHLLYINATLWEVSSFETIQKMFVIKKIIVEMKTRKNESIYL